MKKLSAIFLVLSIILQLCTAPPVTKNKEPEEDNKENDGKDKEVGLEDYMEYHRYLKEVVDALESDPQFREKLEKAEEADIRSGKIAHELEFVNHKVRTKLDEIKRAELERLRHLANKKYEIENGLNFSHEKVGFGAPDKEHLDHENPHTFEIEDLKKLIAKSTKDLAEADRKRREEFKQYEMQKEFEKQEKLKEMDDSHKKEFEQQLHQQEEKHKKHEPLHHPGSKQQLEEVWEKQDHMDQQEFDPKTFFMLHDLDGNGVWDQNEVKTLFIKELDKMYQEGHPEDDMRERIEEMERMREHVFSEVDQNKDGLISYAEFIDQTKKQDFQEDKGWDTIDQNKQFTEEEYRQFEKQRMEEVERLIAQGMLPPHPGAPMYHHDPMGQQQFPPQGYHPGQMPQGHAAQVAQQYHPQGQAQYHPAQGQPQYHPAQGQMHPGQVHPAQQMHPGQQVHPSQQVHPGQVHPAQQGQYQMPQAQIHPGQVHPGQPVQGQPQVQPVQQPHGQPVQQPHPGQLKAGETPQAQVRPQQIPDSNAIPPAPQLPPAGNIQLNTNEILPNQPPAVQQKYQPPTQGQNSAQGQPAQPAQMPNPAQAPKPAQAAQPQVQRV